MLLSFTIVKKIFFLNVRKRYHSTLNISEKCIVTIYHNIDLISSYHTVAICGVQAPVAKAVLESYKTSSLKKIFSVIFAMGALTPQIATYS